MLAVGSSLGSLGRFVLGQPRLVLTANPTSIFQDKSTTNQRLLIRISVSNFERSLLAAGLGEPSLHSSPLGFAQKENAEHVAPDGAGLGSSVAEAPRHA